MRRTLPAMVFFCVGVAWAQTPNSTLPSPRITSVFPSGAQAGASVEIVVRGTDLDEPGALRFSHAGITGELTRPPEPSAKKDAPTKGMKKNAATSTDARFKVTIAKTVPPGTHEVRVVGKFGVSNPRAFTVGTQPEMIETEPNSDVPQAQALELGSVVHGVIDATTDVDYFTFKGKKGQRVLAHCAAGSIDSRARPFVELYAADGRTRLGLNRNDRGTDALCDVTLPADGAYYLRISEFAYTAGGQDYFYRLSLGTGPWHDAIVPPMILPGTTATVTVIGRNLIGGRPAGTIDGKPVESVTATITAPTEARGFTGLANLPQAAGLLDGFAAAPLGMNSLPMFFATAPVVLEAAGDNNTPDKAQVVMVPCELAGSIGVRNDRDCYHFTAKKGEPVVIELFAERLGTNLDAVLSLRDDKGKELSADSPMLDDDPDALHPTSFFNRTTDPAAYRLVPAADGVYTVTVGARDANANYGTRTLYRLRIAAPRPDYRVVVMPRNRDFPSGLTVTAGSETALDVFVQRLDGFSGPVTATLTGLPPGVTAKPAMIGTGQRWGLILLSGAADLNTAERPGVVNATATIDGQDVSRTAASASIVWSVPGSNNTPTITRLDRGLVVAARGGEKLPFRLTAKFDKATIKSPDGKERVATLPLEVKPGEKVSVPVAIEWSGKDARTNVLNLGMEPTVLNANNSAPIAVNNNQPLVVAKEQSQVVVIVEVKANAPPGDYSVHLRGDTKLAMSKDGVSKDKKEYTVIAFAPPIAMTILPTALCKMSSTTGTIKLGSRAQVTVRVERLFDYAGVYAVKIVFPEQSGLSAMDAVIPANSNDVAVTVTAAADAKPGNVSGTVHAVAMFKGKPITGEAKATVTVVK